MSAQETSPSRNYLVTRRSHFGSVVGSVWRLMDELWRQFIRLKAELSVWAFTVYAKGSSYARRLAYVYARARRIRLTTEEGGIRMPIKIQTFVVIYLSAIAYNIYAIYMLSNVPIGPVFIYIAPLWNKLPAALRQISDQSGRLDKTSPFAISSQIISFIQDLNCCLFTNL